MDIAPGEVDSFWISSVKTWVSDAPWISMCCAALSQAPLFARQATDVSVVWNNVPEGAWNDLHNDFVSMLPLTDPGSGKVYDCQSGTHSLHSLGRVVVGKVVSTEPKKSSENKTTKPF